MHENNSSACSLGGLEEKNKALKKKKKTQPCRNTYDEISLHSVLGEQQLQRLIKTLTRKRKRKRKKKEKKKGDANALQKVPFT